MIIFRRHAVKRSQEHKVEGENHSNALMEDHLKYNCARGVKGIRQVEVKGDS